MEADDLARRIIFDISMVFKRQPNLDEFDIIPVAESQNKSPVVHLGTKMALEAWCVKLLYLHAHSNLTQWRERRLKADDDKVAQWSDVALLLNPEVLTFWNVRKELLCRGKISQSDELRLCTLVLTRKPKSPEVFAHRRWLMNKALMPTSAVSELQVDNTPPCREELLKNELLLCTVAASRYPNNYSAWSHRQWVHDNVHFDESDDIMAHMYKDLKWSEDWVQRNVSDHSGLQFRQYLLTKIAKRLNSRSTTTTTSIAQLFSSESDMTRRLICDFPGHETLWYHCRYVTESCRAFSILDEFTGTHGGPTTCKKTKIDSIVPSSVAAITKVVIQSEFRLSLDAEILFADKFISNDGGAQSNLAAAYRKWISQIFGPFTSS